jgi:hypothetical protein
MKDQMLHPSLPWWRVPAAWLVVGGPALVVLASVVTLVIAVRGGDTPLREASAPAARHATAPTPLTPATQARNHAATARP